MDYSTEDQINFNHEDNARFVLDFFYRIMMHHAMWFAEVSQHLGKERAFQILSEVNQTSFEIQSKRIAKTLNYEMEDGIPSPLLALPEGTLINLRNNIAANWLANDGIWFQAVENSNSMADAKHCNDASWEKFSPMEAWSIKRIINLPEQAGLSGLKQALQLRMYAFINKQSFAEETENSFIFRMDDCRVQSARKRKSLDDYPCKSGGTIEYTTFAEAIDSRIKTECICCPPDKHPDEYYCAWRFYFEK